MSINKELRNPGKCIAGSTTHSVSFYKEEDGGIKPYAQSCRCNHEISLLTNSSTESPTCAAVTERFLSADRSSPFSSLTHESDSSRERVLLMLGGPVLVLQKEEFDITCNYLGENFSSL